MGLEEGKCRTNAYLEVSIYRAVRTRTGRRIYQTGPEQVQRSPRKRWNTIKNGKVPAVKNNEKE